MDLFLRWLLKVCYEDVISYAWWVFFPGRGLPLHRRPQLQLCHDQVGAPEEPRESAQRRESFQLVRNVLVLFCFWVYGTALQSLEYFGRAKQHVAVQFNSWGFNYLPWCPGNIFGLIFSFVVVKKLFVRFIVTIWISLNLNLRFGLEVLKLTQFHAA